MRQGIPRRFEAHRLQQTGNSYRPEVFLRSPIHSTWFLKRAKSFFQRFKNRHQIADDQRHSRCVVIPPERIGGL